MDYLIIAYLGCLSFFGVCMVAFPRPIIDWTDRIEAKIAAKIDSLLAKPFLLAYTETSARQFRLSKLYPVAVWLSRLIGLAAIAVGITYIYLILKSQ
jgi:hypothetical protein